MRPTWNPAARIAVILMLGALAAMDSWIFTFAKISSLPVLRVFAHGSIPFLN